MLAIEWPNSKQRVAGQNCRRDGPFEADESRASDY